MPKVKTDVKHCIMSKGKAKSDEYLLSMKDTTKKLIRADFIYLILRQ